MKNKLIDLNNHLFMQLERLGDEQLSAEQLDHEAKRADAIVAVGEQIIRNAGLAIKAAELVAEYGENVGRMMPMIAGRTAEGPEK